MRLKHYILVGHDVVTVPLLEWAAWMERDPAGRRVALDPVNDAVYVSTIFLGLDHNFWNDGPAILFETMVFGGALNHEQDRYATWDEAIAGHARILAHVREIEELEAMTNEKRMEEKQADL